MDVAERQALDELKKGVHDLAAGVKELQAGLVDEQAVERIAADVMAGRRKVQQRVGYTPSEESDGRGGVVAQKIPTSGLERLHAIQSYTPHEVERYTRLDAGDVEEFHKVCDNVAILGAMCQSRFFPNLPNDVRDTRYFADELSPWVQAMDTSTAGEGLEFVPELMSGSLLQRINLALLVATLFDQIPMPSNPFKLPAFAIARQRTGTKAEETGDTGQAKFALITPGSRSISLSAVKFGVRALISREAEEDAIVAMLPFIQRELADFIAADVDDATINGDATSPHQDSDVTDFTDPADPRTAWNGLRLAAPAAAKTDAGNAALTAAMLRTNRSVMSKYGVRSDQLAHLVSMRAYISLLGDANVMTVDKYGPQATILTGELGKVDGAPIVVSEYVRQDLNATGVYDGVTTTRTIAATVNRRAFVRGQRRELTVQVLRELYAESDQDAVVVSTRKAFSPVYPNTEPAVALTYNLA